MYECMYAAGDAAVAAAAAAGVSAAANAARPSNTIQGVGSS